MATSEKSSLQALLQGQGIPDLPFFNPGWSLKQYNDAQDQWKRKLHDYLRRLLQALTGTNIYNEIIQQVGGIGEYPGIYGLDTQLWLEFPWPQSVNPLYGDGPSYFGSDFNSSPINIPSTEKPFWQGVIPRIYIDTDDSRGSPFLNVSGSPSLRSWLCLRMKGQIVPQYSETYTLTFDTDDGVRVFVGGVNIIDDWTYGVGRTNTGTFVGVAGIPQDFQIDYFNLDSTGHLRATWQSSTQVEEEIPYHYLLRKLS